jgi:signal transduction histidine kinase
MVGRYLRVRAVGEDAVAVRGRRRSRLPLAALLGLLTLPPSGALAGMETAREVRRLRAAEAAEGRPAKVTGVVIALAEGSPAFVVMDESDGIYVLWNRLPDRRLQAGDRVEVTGRTGAGDFAPVLVADEVAMLGTAPLPPPLATTLAEVASGGLDAKWIEVEGIVRDARRVPRMGDRVGQSTLLTLAWAEARLRVRVKGELDPAALIDARVRVRGVSYNLHNNNRQFVSAGVQVDGADAIEVLAAPAPDPYSLPLRRAGELLQFDPEGFTGRRVRVQGVVTHQLAGDALWIRDGARGLKVISDQPGAVGPGEVIDIVGFIDRGEYAPSLGSAMFRRIEAGMPPSPIPVDTPEAAVAHEADLIEIEAIVDEVRRMPDGVRLQLDWRGTRLEASIGAGEVTDGLRTFEPRARVRVAGICVVPMDPRLRETGLWPATSFRLLLRSAADIRLVSAAPWWTTRRLNQVLGASALTLLAALVTLGVFWRRQILRRETSRKMAEAEFSAILGERNRMARDIHDSLAQGLNAVSMQLELARNASEKGKEPMLPHIDAAHDIVRSCLSRARESIWNMRSQVLERTDLPGALRDVLHQMTRGLALAAEVTVVGPRRRLAPRLENELLKIGQEAISNVLQHAGASRIEVKLEFEPRRVRMSVTDDGRGLDPLGTLPSAGHFGLAGMRERVEKLHGRFALESEPQRGTVVRVEVDAPAEDSSDTDVA